MSGFRRLEFRLPPSIEGLVVAELWAHGTLGLETLPRVAGEHTLVAFFSHRQEAEATAALAAVTAFDRVELLADETQPDEDWMAAYRRRVQPFALGTRWVVDPGEPVGEGTDEITNPALPLALPPTDGERRLLRLPARRAFGTGEHPSTRLAVELLEEVDPTGLDVLDVGTGSGILSFTALLAGARRVLAVDVDPLAIWAARDHQALNRLSFPLVAGDLRCLRAMNSRFDLALVNVLPEEIRDDLPILRGLVRTDGAAIFSGIPRDCGEEVVRRLRDHGWLLDRNRKAEEWIALVALRAASGFETAC